MAFDVTPTSGEAPYTFTAEYSNTLGIELGLYRVEFRSSTEVGSCPPGGTGVSDSPANAIELLETGTTIVASSVPAGSCRRYINVVRRLSDGSIISQKFVNVSNL